MNRQFTETENLMVNKEKTITLLIRNRQSKIIMKNHFISIKLTNIL